MNASWFVGRRIALALLSIFLVFTAAFAFVALTPDPNVDRVRYFAAGSCQGPSEQRVECIEEKVQAYKQANNLGDPVHVRYARWLRAMVTLDWGVSTMTGLPVTGLITGSLPFTLLYVLPSMLLSAAGGLAVGTYVALNPEEWHDRAATLGTYLVYGLPNFWLAALLLVLADDTYVLPGGYLFSWEPTLPPGARPFEVGTLVRMVLPVLVLSTTLFASQLRHARSETLEHAGSELVKLVRAKGFGDRGVGRHVLRATAPLLVSLFVVDLFGVIVVNVFVLEYVFEIPGFGDLALTAIRRRDMPVLIGATMVIAVLGIAGNLLKDLATFLLDPRIADGER